MTDIPNVRFRGFIDAWEQRKLNELVKYTSSSLTTKDALGKGKYYLYDANTKIGYVNVFPMTKNYITIIKDGAGIGRVRMLPANTTFIGTMGALTAKDSSLEFIYALLNKVNLSEKFSGSTIPHIYFKDYGAEFYYVPNLAEQIQIGKFFHNLDFLITLHQRKCDETKELKKYMIQKMFPQNGKKIPEIRFVGFTDDWEQRKLGEIADIVGGGTPSTVTTDYWGGTIDWYAPAEIADQIYVSSSQKKITEAGYNNSSAKILPVGTVLFTSRAGIGKTAILAKPGCTNQGFQSIVPHKEELDSYFIFARTEEMKRYGETIGAGSTFVEVSGKQMANMKLMMPRTMEEQKRIGNYFSNLDRLITLHQRKCDELKEIKKFMLQNMFPKKG